MCRFYNALWFFFVCLLKMIYTVQSNSNAKYYKLSLFICVVVFHYIYT